MMSVVLVEEKVEIPDWVRDLKSFRRWAYSKAFPERGCISWLENKIWVDLSMEETEHNLIKTEITAVLDQLIKKQDSGRFHSDRYRVSHVGANSSTEPDGMFVSWESLESHRIRYVKGVEAEIELEEALDMALEIVSRSSVQKDRVALKEAYWKAGVTEYWLVDSRRGEFSFTIYTRTPSGYKAARKQQDGWMRSAVFGKSFRLTRKVNERGYTLFALEIR